MNEERITPVKAQAYLNHNKSNRTLRNGVAEKYAADMKVGNWTQCIAPIAFYEDGDVADGQHRLWAIIESNTTQKFYVLRGVDRTAALNIDTGLGRSLLDNSEISGVKVEGMNHATLAISRAIEYGTRGATGKASSAQGSHAQRLAVFDKHAAAAIWSATHGGYEKGFRNAAVNAAIGRAWYVEEDKDRLEQFGSILNKGYANGDGDSAAITLRNYLQSNATGIYHDHTSWRDTFLKVQNAIWNFMRRKRMLQIRTTTEERYPLAKARAPKKSA